MGINISINNHLQKKCREDRISVLMEKCKQALPGSEFFFSFFPLFTEKLASCVALRKMFQTEKYRLFPFIQNQEDPLSSKLISFQIQRRKRKYHGRQFLRQRHEIGYLKTKQKEEVLDAWENWNSQYRNGLWNSCSSKNNRKPGSLEFIIVLIRQLHISELFPDV